MKKFVSILILVAVLLSLCACGKQEETKAPAATEPVPETNLDPQSPEALYGHIDETQPVDGVYKIWSSKGVQNMAAHPDATFEMLCNVDMLGAEVKGFDTFTGEIIGGNWTISNFTLVCPGENYGFAGINKGDIHNLYLDQVTCVPNGARNIGTLAGINEGTILRCRVTGTLTAEGGENCGSLVGVNTGSIANTIVTVDTTFRGDNALVGAIAGKATAGQVEYIDTNGFLTVKGENVKAGLFAGMSEQVVFTNCAFIGADNSLNGVLFTDFTGNEDDEKVTVTRGLWRDNANLAPINENQDRIRDLAVAEMYAMGTMEWHPNDLIHTCTCQLSGCHGTYNKEYTYIGIPYNHKGGSRARMQYCMNEDGTLKDFVYEMDSFDGFDAYIGNDCSTAVAQAWWRVSNSTDIIRCTYMLPCFDNGCYPVGDYNYDVGMTVSTSYTDKIINANSEQTMYEAYGQLRHGDAYAYLIEAGGHTRMVAEDAVTVRDQNGLIDPQRSYVICHEQGYSSTDDENMTTTSWRLNWKYTFANLYIDWAIPVTIEEFITGEMEPATCELTGSVDGKWGMTTGIVKANYFLDSVALKITDDQGNVVMDHRMFTTVGRYYDHNFNDFIIRNYKDDFDMGHFASPLQDVALEKGRTYSYTVTAYLATEDVFTLKEGSFVNGQ